VEFGCDDETGIIRIQLKQTDVDPHWFTQRDVTNL
jgi:hypothetical protein